MKNDGLAIKFYRLERWFYDRNLEFISKIIFRFMQIFLGCTIPYTCDIESGVQIAHFHGVVFVHKLHIGSGSIIYQNVTLGGYKGQYGPKIGRNVIVGAGAVILGEVNMGQMPLF